VHANLVYAELIRDRNHLHMNATKWTSLTEFVKYLGRTGKATVDETPKGLFILFLVCACAVACVRVRVRSCVVCAID
jgi:hypothetical protein